MPDPQYATLVAIVFISGFAIQQILEVFDFLILVFINWLKDEGKDTIWGVPAAVFKKSFTLLLSSSMGIIVACIGKIYLLYLAVPSLNPNKCLDVVVSGLVIGSGTEAVNTLMKFLGYLKEAQKASIIEVTIMPISPKVVMGKTILFRAFVKNGDSSAVEWSMIHGDGGTIDKNTGEYTAPNTIGDFQVLATSKQDTTKTATTTITVIKPPA